MCIVPVQIASTSTSKKVHIYALLDSCSQGTFILDNKDNSEWLSLPRSFTRPDLPVDNGDITKPSHLRKWKYLENVIDQLTFSDDISVGLFIGANCTKALEPTEILQSRDGGPYAFKTRLGWCVVGPVNRTKKNKASCNQVAVNQADTKEVGRHFFEFKKEVKENDLPDMLKQMYNHEFS